MPRKKPSAGRSTAPESLVVRRPAAEPIERAARLHEVRNVMTAVRGWISLARSDAALAPRALEVVADGVERAIRLLDGSPAAPALGTFAVDVAAHRVADLLEASCVARGVSLERAIDAAEGLGDEARTAQIALNFGLNALEAMRDRPGTLRLAVEVDGRSVRVSVSDDGDGMDEEVRARVFEPFFSTKHAEEGARRGVGLAVCRALAESMGAGVEVRSERGRGSTFTLVLRAAGRPLSLSDAPSDGAALRPGLRVLVVDDEAAIRELLEVALSLRGARVLGCADLGEARRAALSGEVDVALVDESLGADESGSALLAELSLVAPRVGRVLMTGAAETAGLAAVAHASLVRKPFALDDIVRALDAADPR